MYLSIIIPAFNEAKRITPTIHEIRKVLESTEHRYEIIVVDDASQDGTIQVISTLQQDIPSLSLEVLSKNLGKGGALKHGVSKAHGDIIITIDADGSTPFAQYQKLLDVYQQTSADIAIGSRHLPASQIVIKQPWYRVLISRVANVLIRMLLLPGIKDTQCGFKLFNANVAKQLYAQSHVQGFGIDMEILYLAKLHEYRIAEVPVTWLNSQDSTLRPIRSTLRTFRELLHIWWRHRVKQ